MPGATVAFGGVKGQGKSNAARVVMARAALDPLAESYIRDFTGFDRPWGLLEQRLDGFRVIEIAFGSGFLVTGRLPATG